MFVNKHFTYLACAYLKKGRFFNVKSSTFYFHMTTKIVVEFHICISVPLMFRADFRKRGVYSKSV